MAETNLWQRLKQRKLGQRALAYLAGAWVLLQLLSLIVESIRKVHTVPKKRARGRCTRRSRRLRTPSSMPSD